MSGYLEGYGAGEAEREKKIRWILLSALAVSVVSGILYFLFRDYKEEKQISRFLEVLSRQDYKAAYTFWGCSEQTPCRDYPYSAFLDDWGPKGVNAKFSAGKLAGSERCGTGLVASVAAGGEQLALWVERSNGVVSYAPWQNCPERKLRLMKWLRMKFGRG
ncbi:MAG: hypothetical protein HY235_22055 [Acidobacteria bacterium]|nr:hypothetical protein [Acidobacteriota bacterium]